MLLGGMFTELLPASILLIVLTVVGWIVILKVKKKYKNPSKPTLAFTLHELNTMLRDGLLTQEEYERAKRSIIKHTISTTTDSHSKPSNGA